MNRLLTFTALLAAFLNISGQTGDTVRSIYIDEYNAKWIGSDLGLLRFDGTTWQAYHTRDGVPGVVNAIAFEDAEDGPQIWVGTDNGVIVAGYDNEQVTSAERYHSGNSELASDEISAIVLDSSDTRYFATPEGLGVFETDQWTWLERGWGPAEGGISNSPLLSLGAKNDTVYAGAETRGAGRVINEIDGFSGASYYEIPWTGIAGNTVKSILTDDEGFQWFGTTDGISQHTHQDGDIGWDLTLTTSDGLVDNSVNSIFQSSDGNFWFGTDAGVSNYEPGEGTFTNYTTSDGLADGVVFDIAEDSDNQIWFATANGISSFDGSEFTSYATGEQAKDFINIITSVKPGVPGFAHNFIDVYPNPASSHLYIHFRHEGGPVQVRIYDPSGRMVNTLLNGNPGEGELKLRWDLDDAHHGKVKAGIYVVSVHQGDRKSVRKVIVY